MKLRRTKQRVSRFFKHALYWTILSMQLSRSIWDIVAKFHNIPSYHLTDFQFLLIVVTDFSYWHDLLHTMHVTCITHEVILLINKMLSNKDRVLIKVLRVEKGYGTKTIITALPSRNWSLVSVKPLLHQTDTIRSAYCKSRSGQSCTARSGTHTELSNILNSQNCSPDCKRNWHYILIWFSLILALRQMVRITKTRRLLAICSRLLHISTVWPARQLHCFQPRHPTW